MLRTEIESRFKMIRAVFLFFCFSILTFYFFQFTVFPSSYLSNLLFLYFSIFLFFFATLHSDIAG